jgi:electron transfer flavoprotein alpha subunit
MTESKRILVCGELQEDGIAPIALELLGAGRKLADELGAELGVIFLGSGLDAAVLEATIASGADRVYTIDNALLKDHQTDACLAAMHQVCQKLTPDILLFGQTSLGRDLAPRLAFRLGVGLVMDCTDLKIDPQTGLLVRTKPVYGGNAMASYVSEARPQLATLRAKAMAAAEPDPSRRGEVIAVEVALDPAVMRTRVIARTEEKEGAGKRLEAAEAVVCGGRGIGSGENFALLEELARLLNGAVGATRPPCDLGWVPSELQIGLTGKIIAPGLYIGVAVSGSSAHLAGFSNAKNIVAINNDPEANIFRVAHYGIVGDYKKILPLIIDAGKKLVS